ncbi:uncharacterized protein BDZ99DRAFT_514320 [Mytilinidion resinicola]|uniref:Uncharacterized protein n=1 Tax=Mytilinidion resinicola TaxID=574789 RepID=A0A6A6Z3K5_9PEZI|nr:uncharacterized protein BDZ99DRAFT_514320 [Mytilinidion resinicola]KAF2815666.1 hypothetical protein BDZ99DRAFT_514320 [Mytilinidion resinicola]
MAVVRDPAFWRRFSMAVHLDEEAQNPQGAGPELKHSDSWLARQNLKSSRRTFICWIFWLVFAALVAGIVIVVLFLKAKAIIH